MAETIGAPCWTGRSSLSVNRNPVNTGVHFDLDRGTERVYGGSPIISRHHVSSHDSPNPARYRYADSCASYVALPVASNRPSAGTDARSRRRVLWKQNRGSVPIHGGPPEPGGPGVVQSPERLHPERPGADSRARRSAQANPTARRTRNRQSLRHPTLALSLIHISEPTRLGMISYAVFCLKKKKK